MTIRGLGDVNVETTIELSGQGNDSQIFTQTSNATYDVDVSTTRSVFSAQTVDGSSSSSNNNGPYDTEVSIGVNGYVPRCEFNIQYEDTDDPNNTSLAVDYRMAVLSNGNTVTEYTGTFYIDGSSHSDSATFNKVYGEDKVVVQYESNTYFQGVELTVYDGESQDVNVDSITQS